MDSKQIPNGFKSNPRGYILIQSITLVRIPLSVIFFVVLIACKESTLTLVLALCLQAFGSFLAILGSYYWDRIGNWSFYALSWIIITVTFLSSIEYIRDAFRAIKNK